MDYNVQARSAGDERDPGTGVPVPEGVLSGAHDWWITKFQHGQLVKRETLAWEARIHEFLCQKAPFLELRIDGL
jgi:hypothetical protein